MGSADSNTLRDNLPTMGMTDLFDINVKNTEIKKPCFVKAYLTLVSFYLILNRQCKLPMDVR